MIADNGAGAFGGRERTVDADVNLVHKLSSNMNPMRIKDRTAPLFVSLDVKAEQLVGPAGAARGNTSLPVLMMPVTTRTRDNVN